MLCPSSRPAALVFVLAVLDFMRHMRVTPTTNVIKLLFEFMRKLLLCSLVVGVILICLRWAVNSYSAYHSG